MKCEWSQKPVSAAMSVIRLSVVVSSVRAAFTRTCVMYLAGDICVSLVKSLRNCATE